MAKTPPTELHELVLSNLTPGAAIAHDRFNPSRLTFEFEIIWRNFSHRLSISRESWDDKRYEIIRVLSRFSVPYPEVTRGGNKFWVIFHDRDVTVERDKTIWRYGLLLDLNQEIIEVPVEISEKAHAILDAEASRRGLDERAFRLGVGLCQIKNTIDRIGQIQKGSTVGIDSTNVAGLFTPLQAVDQELREYASRKLHLAYKGKDAAVHLRFDWIDLVYLGSSEADFHRALSLWSDREWNVNGLVVSPMKPLLERLDREEVAAGQRRSDVGPKELKSIKKSERRYGKWEIMKSLSEGGQAHTFLVKDISDRTDTQPYVLKRLKNPGRIERFKREIEIGLRLSHPNLIKIVDFDLKAERPYLVTEYCEGGDLEKRGAGEGLGPLGALRMMIPICHGVAHAHGKGVTHRDINPKNIFLKRPDGPPVVGDFGICHVDEQGRRLTLMEEAVGPRLYMSPELEDGRSDHVSPRSDVYSLGKLLYWLITGEIFAREKHREPHFDIVKRYKEVRLEHVNLLLDRMIVADLDKRLSSTNAVLKHIDEVIYMVERGFNVVGAGVGQPCIYCGKGMYRLEVSDDATQVRNFGFDAVGTSKWKIFVCDHCGNVQSFRPDLTKNPGMWD